MFKALRQEIRYNLLLVEIEDKKTISNNRYVYKLKFQDSNGRLYLADYITRLPQQEQFKVGQRTTFRMITPSPDSVKNAEIVPIEFSKQEDEFEIIEGYLPAVTGTSYLNALNAAVSLKNAETQSILQPMNSQRTGELLDLADTINTWLVKHQAERILDSM